jgi:hypothetical protein
MVPLQFAHISNLHATIRIAQTGAASEIISALQNRLPPKAIVLKSATALHFSPTIFSPPAW